MIYDVLCRDNYKLAKLFGLIILSSFKIITILEKTLKLDYIYLAPKSNILFDLLKLLKVIHKVNGFIFSIWDIILYVTDNKQFMSIDQFKIKF